MLISSYLLQLILTCQSKEHEMPQVCALATSKVRQVRQGRAPALQHLCHGKVLEMAAWHPECVCGHKHISSDRNEMGKRFLSPTLYGEGEQRKC